ILAENMIRHLEDEKLRFKESGIEYTTNEIVYNATAEVSGAILTAVLTTIISFIPVFTLIGAEGKLFRPLAFTKTMALSAALVIALFLIPPFAAFLFRKTNIRERSKYILNGLLIILGITAIVYGYWLGLILIAYGVVALLSVRDIITTKRANLFHIIISCIAIVFLLAEYWRPLGFDRSILMNLI
ncbi:efflux RND transporter permease subunit, partial [Leeuwenhoekiella marinoflava]